jgi:hypothetical protein
MATMNRVIKQVDVKRPNNYKDEEKYRWINSLDGMIAREVMHTDAPCYDCPADADIELLIRYPYEDLYELYVTAQIELADREYNEYNQIVLVFQERLAQFKAWYIQQHRPPKHNVVWG